MKTQKNDKWIIEPLTREDEFEFLQNRKFHAAPKEWVLSRLKKRPLYFQDLAQAAKTRELSKKEVVTVLKQLFTDGNRFCMIANPKEKRYVKVPMIFVSGTTTTPFSNCYKCPANKNCAAEREKRL